MASYKNFESRNNKHSVKSSRSVHDADFNSNVNSKGDKESSHLNRNIDKYVDLISYWRWWPDRWLDLIKPEKGGIELHSDQRLFLRAAVRFQAMYGVFNRGYGKCVAGDTMVFSQDGIKEIGEYFDYMKDDGEKWIPHDSSSVINRYGDQETISSLYYGGYKDTKKIKTEYGYELEGTLNHPVLKMNEDGIVDWCNMEDLKPGDFLAISKNNFAFGNNNSSFELNYKEIPKEVLQGTKKNVVEFFKMTYKYDVSNCDDEGNILILSDYEKFNKQFQMMLLNIGVISKRFSKGVLIRQKNVDKFLKFINEESCDLDDDYFFSAIEEIKDSKNCVYDFSLPETHSFVSNGFVSHNTFNEVLAMFVMAVLFPGIEFALTAQTKENAAELLRAKHDDIIKKYPWFKNEIYDTKFSKNDAEVLFLNDSKIDVLANSQSAKGQRRNSIMIEESALLDDITFQDALSPITEHGRLTVGSPTMTNPEELHQKISFFTTAGFSASDEFQRSNKMLDGMTENNGDFVLGSDWRLACWYGRGSNKQQILKRKKNMSSVAFDQNYNSKWTGVSNNAIVDINRFLNLRKIKNAQVDNKKKDEIYLSMDVARSQSESNNMSSIAVLKVNRSSEDRVTNIQLVNLISLPNGLNYSDQVLHLKRYFKIFNASKIIYDHNGLGSGIGDEIVKEHYDYSLGETLPAMKIINIDLDCEFEDAEKCVYAIQSQASGFQTEMIVEFMSMVDSEKLHLLEKRTDNAFDDVPVEELRPFVETDRLVDEVANLKLKSLNAGKLTLERATTAIDKDRFTALAYGIWYINKNEDKSVKVNDVDVNKFMMFKKPTITKL